jgi:hypothetical protein
LVLSDECVVDVRGNRPIRDSAVLDEGACACLQASGWVPGGNGHLAGLGRFKGGEALPAHCRSDSRPNRSDSPWDVRNAEF